MSSLNTARDSHLQNIQNIRIAVELPTHLRLLARVEDAVILDIGKPSDEVSQRVVLDALEARYPMLVGTIRDRATRRRRPMIRFFASGEDISHADPDASLPQSVTSGTEPLLIIAAMAGG